MLTDINISIHLYCERRNFLEFLQQLKTTLFGRAEVGSASEQYHLKRRYINVCNE